MEKEGQLGRANARRAKVTLFHTNRSLAAALSLSLACCLHMCPPRAFTPASRPNRWRWWRRRRDWSKKAASDDNTYVSVGRETWTPSKEYETTLVT